LARIVDASSYLTRTSAVEQETLPGDRRLSRFRVELETLGADVGMALAPESSVMENVGCFDLERREGIEEEVSTAAIHIAQRVVHGDGFDFTLAAESAKFARPGRLHLVGAVILKTILPEIGFARSGFSTDDGEDRAVTLSAVQSDSHWRRLLACLSVKDRETAAGRDVADAAPVRLNSEDTQLILEPLREDDDIDAPPPRPSARIRHPRC
jgi:hypothetical protein